MPGHAPRERLRGGRSCVLVAGAMLVVGVSTGCSADRPAPAHEEVGPAPLRRMTNAEYTNALHDLFPTLHPPLPPLPDDAVVAGFENAAEVQQPSDVRVARYETIANLYAEAATRDAAAVRALVGCDAWTTPSDQAECGSGFVARTGGRLFRRPLLDEERERLATRLRAWTSEIDFEAAVRLTLSAMLQSPQFLYRAEPVPTDLAPGSVAPVEPYAMASRLSFFLWESVPDDALLAAAARDDLRTDDQIRAHAARMLADERARRVFWGFHRQWLGLDRILFDEHAVRTPEVDPGWTAATQASAHAESRLFVENVAMAGGSLADLLTSRRAWVDAEMARVYRIPAPSAPGAWTEVALPEGERAGLLTRVAFVAGTSHPGATSPPIRGNALRYRALCKFPLAPPPDADLSQPKADPAGGPQTNRMLYEARTRPPACQTCHVGLNGIGFGFESYSASGATQATDDGLPVDARGALYGTDVDGPFVGPVELSRVLARSRDVLRCAARQWVRYALGRAAVEAEEPAVDAVTARFVERAGDLRSLLLDVVTLPSFRARRIEERP